MKSCGTTVQNALRSVDGVSIAIVSFDEKLARVWVSKQTQHNIQMSTLIDIVEIVGFEASPFGTAPPVEKIEEKKRDSIKLFNYNSTDPVTPSKLHLSIYKVSGMTCTNCSAAIQRCLSNLNNSNNLNNSGGNYDLKINNVKISLLTGRLEVSYSCLDRKETECELIILNQVEAIGYDCVTSTCSSNSTSSSVMKFTVFDISSSSALKLVSYLSSELSCDAHIINDDGDDGGKGLGARHHDDGNVVISVSSSSISARRVIELIKCFGYSSSSSTSSSSSSSSSRSTMDDGGAETARWRSRLIWALIFGVPVAVLHLVLSLSSSSSLTLFDGLSNTILTCSGRIPTTGVIMFLLNFPLQFVIGFHFYVSAFKGMLNRNFGMDFLIMSGTTIAFAYSTMQMVMLCVWPSTKQTMIGEMSHDSHLFFEVSGMLIMFVTIGKYLEHVAKREACLCLTELVNLQPLTAFLVDVASPSSSSSSSSSSSNFINEREIAQSQIEQGDVLKVYPGSRIPTDGIIISGASFVDESMMSGEPIPVAKTINNTVIGCTINQHGLIYIRATSVGADSALSQIIRLVEEAQMNAAPIQSYADYIASIFTPVVFSISIVTFFIWLSCALGHQVPSSWMAEQAHDPYLFALLFAISVIVVSCPCALGLATPTAVMVGTSVGAVNGILIKGGAVLERAHQVNVVVFDKTGTLTVGKPMVCDVVPVMHDDDDVGLMMVKQLMMKKKMKSDGVSDEALLLLTVACTVEHGSLHPIAQAISKHAMSLEILPLITNNNNDDDDDGGYETVPGEGCKCRLSSSSSVSLLVGNLVFMSNNNIQLSPQHKQQLQQLEEKGHSVVCVAINTSLIGFISVSDIIKPESFQTISLLTRHLNLKVYMLTGDSLIAARSVAAAVGIPSDCIKAHCLPAGKSNFVSSLQAQGMVVAMIGDGINDSPALAQADVGIAIGAGTQVAMEAADIVLVRNNLLDVLVALDLSRVVFHRIRYNFCWALVYNVVMIPFAAGILYPFMQIRLPPAYAGLAMAMSSVSVVVSSLMLRCYRKPFGKGLMKDSVVAEDSEHEIRPNLFQRLFQGSYQQIPSVDDSKEMELVV